LAYKDPIMLSMITTFNYFPLLFGYHYLLCHKLDTKGGEKHTLKKNILNQPFIGLVTLDKMVKKKTQSIFVVFVFKSMRAN
jgi:hypothetical protein